MTSIVARTTQTDHRMQRLLPLALLALAFVARFRYLMQIEHNIDHAYPIWQALRTIDQGVLPLIGQGTSVLFANPPLTGYLLIPVTALTRSPLGAYVFIIALNSLGVWFAYQAVRGLLGWRLALVAAALMAVNPWVIEYSRTSWVQALLPFLVTAVAWLLWPVLTGASQRPVQRTALALGVMGVLMHTYLLAYFAAVPVIVLLVIYRRRVPWRGVLIGSSFVMLLAVPYWVGLAGDWATVSQRTADFAGGESRLSLEAWDAAVRLITGHEYELARGLQAPVRDTERRHTASQIAHVGLLATLLLGIGAAVRAIVRRTANRDAAIIALVWFGLPVLAMSYTSSPVHPFYQLLGLPAGYLLTAWGLSLIFQPVRSRTGAAMLLVLYLPFAGLMLTNSARYYQETAVMPGAHHLTALPLDVGLEWGETLREMLPEGGTLYANDAGWIANSFAGDLFEVIGDTRAPHLTIVPAAGGAYTIIDSQTPLVPEVATRVESILMPNDVVLTTAALPATSQLDLELTPLEIPTQQGMTLVGYDLTHASGTWSLLTAWRIDHIAPEVNERIYAPFFHLFNAEGERLLMLDGEGMPGYRWRPGDLHLQRVEFALPDEVTGQVTLHIGQFDGLNNANLIFLPTDNEPATTVRLTFDTDAHESGGD
jgi:4-amino-4-deoxy-L-arabinose transferase-like glycosyltransferase